MVGLELKNGSEAAVFQEKNSPISSNLPLRAIFPGRKSAVY